MPWTFTDDLDTYLATAGAAVAARPARNTLLLTVADTLRRRGSEAYGEGVPRFGWWRGVDGRVAGALLWTPPHAVLVGTLPPEAVAPLARACAELGGPAVNAERDTARALAAWWGRTGAGVTTVLEQRLYRLGVLTPPDPAPPGRARVATPADRGLLVEWVGAFRREVGHPAPGAARAVDERLAYGGLTLWEHDGVPVALAGEVLLFTDLANPTSNRVYQRIGYRGVVDRVEIAPAA